MQSMHKYVQKDAFCFFQQQADSQPCSNANLGRSPYNGNRFVTGQSIMAEAHEPNHIISNKGAVA